MTDLIHCLLAYSTSRAPHSLLKRSVTLSALSALSLLLLSSPSAARPSAEERAAELECGHDRRCRLERLKRRSQQRKGAQLKLTDRRSYEAMQLSLDRENSDLPRYRRPWGVDLMAATEGLYAGTGRYSFNEHWQVGLNVGLASISDTVKQQRRVLSLTLTEPALSAQVEGLYMSSASSSSPFVGLGVRYLQGAGTVRDTQAPSTGGGGIIGLVTDIANNLAGGSGAQQLQETGELELHLLSAKVGFDYQTLGNGLHVRLAVSYHYPLYAGHRDSSSGKNLNTKASLKDWASSDLTWDIELSLGWSL